VGELVVRADDEIFESVARIERTGGGRALIVTNRALGGGLGDRDTGSRGGGAVGVDLLRFTWTMRPADIRMRWEIRSR